MLRKKSSKKSKSRNLFSPTCSENDESCCNTVIQKVLGLDDQGHCLHHPNQKLMKHLTSSKTSNGYEEVKKCKICCSVRHAGDKPRLSRSSSMAQVITSIDKLQSDKKRFRRLTKVMYNGKSVGSMSEDEMLLDSDIDDGGDAVISDEDWKAEVKERIRQVRGWDESFALKENEVYSKYFRLLNIGIPLEAVKSSCETDGNLPWILNLDGNQCLLDQLQDVSYDPSDSDKVKEICSLQSAVEPIENVLDQITEAFCKRLEIQLETEKKSSKNKSKKKKTGKTKIRLSSSSKNNDVVETLIDRLDEKEKTIEWLKEKLLETNDVVKYLTTKVYILEESRREIEKKVSAKDCALIATVEQLKAKVYLLEAKMTSPPPPNSDLDLATVPESPTRQQNQTHTPFVSPMDGKMRPSLDSSLISTVERLSLQAAITMTVDHAAQQLENNVDIDDTTSDGTNPSPTPTTKPGISSLETKNRRKTNGARKKPRNKPSKAKLRSQFKANTKKLIMLNRHVTMLTAEANADKKGYTDSHHIPALKEVYLDDHDDDGPNYDENNSKQSIAVKIVDAPKMGCLSKLSSSSSSLSNNSKRKKKKNIDWSTNIYQIRAILRIYTDDDIKEQCFYSDYDIKMFRFDQVMEENPEEFEVIESGDETNNNNDDDDDDVWEEELIDEVNDNVRDDEEFDEITVEDDYFEELNDSGSIIFDA